MRLLYISPTSAGVMAEHYARLCQSVASAGTTVTVTYLDYEPRVANLPPTPIYQEALFDRIRSASCEGYDAAIVACYADPGLKDGSRVSDLAVFGALQLGMHAASLLGRQVCVLSPGRKDGTRGRPLSWHRDNLYSYCFRPEVVTYRRVALDRPAPNAVAEMMAAGEGDRVRELILTAHRDAIAGEALTQARQAVTDDGAEVILLGCTLWGGMAAELERLLGCPVVDPVFSIVQMAEATVRARTYAKSVIRTGANQRDGGVGL